MTSERLTSDNSTLNNALPMRASANVVIIRAGKIAAIRSAKHAGALEIPGGKSEQFEIPAHTAVRECFEEIGVRPYLIRPLLTEPVGGFMCYTFFGRIGDHVELVSSEEGEAGWFTPEEMLTGTYSKHTAKWLPLVADELKMSACIFAIDAVASEVT